MHKILTILLLCCCIILNAQDKLFFKNGKTKKGIIVTNARDYIYFKANDTAATEKIRKNDLVLMEDYKGTRYLFSGEDQPLDSVKPNAKKSIEHRNVISVQPLALLFGRANFSYERLSKDGKLGVVIPLILTFDPAFGNIFTADSNGVSQHLKGMSYITGLDLNYYLGRSESFKIFIGPRIRYGTDIAFFNTEGYSLQTQIGMRLGRPAGKVVQHLSVGFGFVRVISSSLVRYDAKQSHMWFSLNYRFGFRW